MDKRCQQTEKVWIWSRSLKSPKINETQALLLHTRKYSETSLICELFSKDLGRVSVIAKGARSKKNKFQNIAAPNILANITFSGKSDLKTLTTWEEIKFFKISGRNLKILLYLHELIFKLLEKEDKQENIFNAVIDFYKVLETSETKVIEISLRQFEYYLICELGYGFNFHCDDSGKKIIADKEYFFHPSQGFTLGPPNNDFLKVSGIDIINFSERKITSATARANIKKIMQFAIINIAERPLNAGGIFND